MSESPELGRTLHSSWSRIPPSPISSSPPDRYLSFVKSHYRYHPESSPYYQQLLDYISESHSGPYISSLQAPQTFSINSNADEIGYFGTSQEDRMRYPFRLSTEVLSAPMSGPRITILEGFPSPNCIATLGELLLLRAELFLGHLELEKLDRTTPRLFSEPLISLVKDNIIHITLPVLGDTKDDDFIVSMEAKRCEAEAKMRIWTRNLRERKMYGASRFRNVHVHNNRFFSMEQLVSFTVGYRKEDNHWEGEKFIKLSTETRNSDKLKSTGVFLIDNGRDISDQDGLPWMKTSGRGVPSVFLPTVAGDAVSSTDSQFETHPLDPITKVEPLVNLSSGNSTVPLIQPFGHPYHPLRYMYIKDEDDLKLLRQSPFFFMLRLLSVAAISWSQQLRFLEHEINIYQSISTRQGSIALEQFRHCSAFLGRIQTCLKENLRILSIGGSPNWPKPKETRLLYILEDTKNILISDYKLLVNISDELLALCEKGSSSFVSAAQLIEAQRGIDHQVKMNLLTKFAFALAPTALVASCFGMNVKEFDPNPSIWIFAVAAVAVTFIAWVVLNYEEYAYRISARWRRWKKKKEARL
ncbi:hypothetical protein TWF694_004750 [Orbilia ellipsospora]|uniref:Uncharacterized protein n=1 Tax=Orbilia ellipsospora TaxID=2528407 RepID=A0AAV9WYA7_9PEZI